MFCVTLQIGALAQGLTMLLRQEPTQSTAVQVTRETCVTYVSILLCDCVIIFGTKVIIHNSIYVV